MATTDVSQFKQRWAGRLAQVEQAGLDVGKAQSVMNQDWAKMQAGGTPMSGMEATVQIKAAVLGHGEVSPPPSSHGLMGILSNIPSDIGGMVRNIPKIPEGLVKSFVHDIPRMGELPGDIGKSLSQAAGGDFGGALRTMADAPGMQTFLPLATAAIPFVGEPLAAAELALSPASKLTTAEGRKELAQHPLSEGVLQVVPGGKWAELGGEGLVKAGLVDAAKVDVKTAALEAAKTAATKVNPAEELTKLESVYSAMKAGHPVQAGYRALTPGALQGWAANRATEFLGQFGLDHIGLRMSRGTAEVTNEQQTALNELVKDAEVFYKDKTPEEVADFSRRAKDPRGQKFSPEEQALIHHAENMNAVMAEEGVFRGKKDQPTLRGELYPIVIGDEVVHFATTGPEGEVAQLYQASAKAQQALERARTEYARTSAVVEQHRAQLQGLVDRAKAMVDYWAQYKGGTGKRFIAAQDRLARERAKLAAVDQRNTHVRAAQALTDARKASEAMSTGFMKKLIDTAPARYQPMLENELKTKAKAKLGERAAKGEITSDQLNAALDHLERKEAGSYFTQKEWNEMRREVRRGWLNLVAAGYDPLWVHTVSSARLGSALSPKILSDRFWTPSQYKNKVFDLTPRIESVGVALTSAAMEHARANAVREVVNRYLVPTMVGDAEMHERLEPAYQAALKGKRGFGRRDRPPSAIEGPDVVWQKVRDEEFVEFDPEQYGLKRPVGRGGVADKQWVPKHVAESFDRVTRGPSTSGASRLATRSTSFLKANLFFLSPRHFSHVVLGGALAMMVKGGHEEITSALEAWKLAKSGKMDPRMSRGIDTMSTDQIMHYAAGRWAGSRLAKINGALGHLEETLSNWERCMAYLGEEKRGVRKKYTAEHAAEVAAEHVNKTFVDWNGMTPFERTIIRQYFPFYGFTKYVVRFLLSLPADHPIRTAVMAHIAETENQDWNSGLPQQLQKLFFIGSPDKNGNVNVSDIKSINPFRDAQNIFSVWGMLGGMHPAIQEVMKGVGINTMSGTPELYPQIDYDPTTGRLIAQRPGISPLAVGEAFMPWAKSVDDFFGLSSQMRRQKATDPNAYRRNLLSSLGVPFVPYRVNVATELAAGEKARYMKAQNIVSDALKTGDTSTLQEMPLVPWKGHLVPGASLASLLDWYTQHYPGYKPKEVMPHTRTV